MTPTAQIQAFAQSVYLVIKNRYFDDLTTTDGQTFLAQVIDWTNQYIDELENEVGSNGEPLDWNWMRQNGYSLGTIATGDSSISLGSSINNVLTDQGRYVQITVNGDVISNWSVVAPGDAGDLSGQSYEDTCYVAGSTLYFSRPFNSKENGGTVTADVTTFMPRLSTTNVKILSLVKPKQLLILGVAKNATLPDIVQGGLSPSYVQKYNDLLKNAIARNEASSLGGVAERDDLSYIAGVGF